MVTPTTTHKPLVLKLKSKMSCLNLIPFICLQMHSFSLWGMKQVYLRPTILGPNSASEDGILGVKQMTEPNPHVSVVVLALQLMAQSAAIKQKQSAVLSRVRMTSFYLSALLLHSDKNPSSFMRFKWHWTLACMHCVWLCVSLRTRFTSRARDPSTYHGYDKLHNSWTRSKPGHDISLRLTLGGRNMELVSHLQRWYHLGRFFSRCCSKYP